MLDTYKFALCPLGNGMDTAPKILECLFFKCVPICKKTNHITRVYAKYPILWVDSWEDITKDLLDTVGNTLYEILINSNYIEDFKTKNILSNIKNCNAFNVEAKIQS